MPIRITETDLHEAAKSSELFPGEHLSVYLGRGISVARSFAMGLVFGVDDRLGHIVRAPAGQPDKTIWAHFPEAPH